MKTIEKRWIVLMACCLVNLCLGSIYAWSVFSASMAEYLSVSAGREITSADLAIVYTIANAVGPVTMIAGGWINERFGPGKVIASGGLLFGGGMILSGFASGISFLMVSYGVIAGLGLGMAYGCTISTSVKYFPEKRGMIGGVVTAVYGLSSVLVSPLVSVIVGRWDAAFAFKSTGTIFLVLITGCGVVIEHSLAGNNSVIEDRSKAAAKQAEETDKNWQEMLKSKKFYFMLLLLTCGAFSGMMIISQAAGIAVQMAGMSAMAAGTAVSVLALFNAAGRIGAGWISDRMGRIPALMLSCILSSVGMLLLYRTGLGDTAIFYTGIAAVGICFGAFMGIYPGFTADQFGMKYNGVNYGIMFIGFAFAGYLGPAVMKFIYSTTGTYQGAFLIAAGLNVVGIVLARRCRTVIKKKVIAS